MDNESSVETHVTQSYSVPWKARDVWLGFAIFGLLVAFAALLLLLIQRYSVGLNIGLAVSLGELLLLGPVWWLALRKYRVGWETLGLRPFKGEMIGLGCGLMLISFLFNFVYGLFLGLFGLSVQVDLVPILAELSSPWFLLVGGAVVAPAVEEIFFRGFVFAGLRPRYGWQRAALISSGLFALIHLTPTAVIPIFILGYIFAYLYHRSHSLWPAILMHAGSNTLALGAAYVMANTNLGG